MESLLVSFLIERKSSFTISTMTFLMAIFMHVSVAADPLLTDNQLQSNDFHDIEIITCSNNNHHRDLSAHDGRNITFTMRNVTEGCKVEIFTTRGYGIGLEVSTNIENTISPYIYIERFSDTVCRTVTAPDIIHALGCCILFFKEEHLSVFARGDVGLRLHSIKPNEVVSHCSGKQNDTMQTGGTTAQKPVFCKTCEQFQTYDLVEFGHPGVVYAVPWSNEFNPLNKANITVYDVQCPENCICTLRHREWRIDCPHRETTRTFLVYPKTTSKLSFSNTGLCNIPLAEAFQEQVDLTELYLDGNQLDYLIQGVFQHLTNLQELYLHRNALTVLQNTKTKPVITLFQGLENLEVLNLKSNNLHYLEHDVFVPTRNLKELFLASNNLTELQTGVFNNLTRLETLDLGYNQISHLQQGLFNDLFNLELLDLRRNTLQSLEEGVFDSLYNVDNLYLNDNNLKDLPPSVFRELRNLAALNLTSNAIETIHSKSFDGLENLVMLLINYNNIRRFPSGTFESTYSIGVCNFDHNILEEIQPDLFWSLSNMTVLYLNNNNLTRLESGVFDSLINLWVVDLSFNNLIDLPIGLFSKQIILDTINLNNNKLSTLSAGIFGDSASVSFIQINHNRLRSIDVNAFAKISSTASIELNNNKLSVLKSGVFDGLRDLQSLDLSSNALKSLRGGLFDDCESLETLNIKGNRLELVTSESFSGLSNRTAVLVDRYATCCFIDVANCFAEQARSPFLTCKRLLPYYVLRITIWFLGACAFIGNIAVIFYRSTHFRQQLKIQLILVVNLAISDFLMGAYLLLLSSADVYFGKYFPSYAEEWREGYGCQFASVLSTLSGEASVFFVTIISVDRFLGVRFPFKQRILGTRLLIKIILFLWFTAFFLSIAPNVFSGVDNRLDDVSEVCTSLPLVRWPIIKTENRSVDVYSGYFNYSYTTVYYEHSEVVGTKPGMHFSLAVFVGLNLLCFLIVAFCYLQIFILARRSSKGAGRNQSKDEELRMALKMFAVVCTDFCCWVPIIILCILVQSELVTVSPETYAWTVAFFLPINSSINPFVYTFMAAILSPRKSKDHDSNISSCTTASLTRGSISYSHRHSQLRKLSSYVNEPHQL